MKDLSNIDKLLDTLHRANLANQGQRRSGRWASHNQTQDVSESWPIRYCAVLQSRVIQELDLASGSLVIDNDRILPNRRCLSVLADVPYKISNNVDPRMGKGTSKFGHRVGPEDGTRCEKAADNCCENCGRDDIKLALRHTGHHTIDPYGMSGHVFGKETPGDLLLLCCECHLRKHVDLNGDWWTDPQEKET